MKVLVGAFNQEKALVGAFSVIVEPMDRFTALFYCLQFVVSVSIFWEDKHGDVLLEQPPATTHHLTSPQIEEVLYYLPLTSLRTAQSILMVLLRCNEPLIILSIE